VAAASSGCRDIGIHEVAMNFGHDASVEQREHRI
jgi:hypothetical protein